MIEASDSRIPVVIGHTDRSVDGDYVLDLSAASAEAGHPLSCACCAPRSAVARLLGTLFVARARAEIAPFARLLVTGADAKTVAAAIEADVLARARYRFAGPA